MKRTETCNRVTQFILREKSQNSEVQGRVVGGSHKEAVRAASVDRHDVATATPRRVLRLRSYGRTSYGKGTKNKLLLYLLRVVAVDVNVFVKPLFCRLL